jgi:alkanesulfonate monooxygenase SsuD/methylene tetrahydromethanopterin reductase-like flavin-dependent oxidoreductase (luciferase family)
VPFADRGRRTDDHVAALRALWADGAATYHGEFTDFTNCLVRPRPVNGLVPMHVGGHTEIAARRAGGWATASYPGKGDTAELARLFETVRRTAVECGRDPHASNSPRSATARSDRRLSTT